MIRFEKVLNQRRGFRLIIAFILLTTCGCSLVSQRAVDDSDSRALSEILGRDKKTNGAKTVSIGVAAKYIGALKIPVPDGRFSSPFGWRNGSFHEGIDISAKRGTPIYASHGGEVIFSSNDLRGYGKTVVIKGEGLLTVYGHNSANLVSKGDVVSAGEEIAQVGSSGNASGNHCHFETRVRASSGRYVAVNPWAFFRRSLDKDREDRES